jgi:hypothetical protein
MKLAFKSRRKVNPASPAGSEPLASYQMQQNPQGYIWRSRRKPIAATPRHTFDFKGENRAP